MLIENILGFHRSQTVVFPAVMRSRGRLCGYERSRSGRKNLVEIIESLFIIERIAVKFEPILVVRRNSARYLRNSQNAVLLKPDKGKRVCGERRVFLKNAARKEEINIGNRKRTANRREHKLLVFCQDTAAHPLVRGNIVLCDRVILLEQHKFHRQRQLK